MKRNVYLDGELGQLFGTEYTMNVETVSDVFRCLEANYPNVRKYILDSIEDDINFSVKVGTNELSAPEEMFMNFGPGDIYITPQPAGSKGGGKLLAAVAIGAAVVFTGGAIAGALAGGAGGAGGAAGSLAAGAEGAAVVGKGAAAAKGLTLKGALTKLGTGMLANLALAGLQKLLAPDPSVDNEEDESYLFQGSAQTAEEGDPVPVLYGELRVPGRPVSFHVRSLERAFYNDGGEASGYQNVDIGEEEGLPEDEDNGLPQNPPGSVPGNPDEDGGNGDGDGGGGQPPGGGGPEDPLPGGPRHRLPELETSPF